MRWRSEKTGEVIGFDDGEHLYAAVDEERVSCHPYHDPTKPCNPNCKRRTYVPFPKDGYPWVRLDDGEVPGDTIIELVHRSANRIPEYRTADVLVHAGSGNLFTHPYSVTGSEKTPDGKHDVKYRRVHEPGPPRRVVRLATRSMTCMTAEEWRSRPDLSGVFNAVDADTGEPVRLEEFVADEMTVRLAKAYANWLGGPLRAVAVNGSIPVEPERLRCLVHLVEFTDVISFSSAAKDVLPEMARSGDDAWTCIARLGLAQSNDEELIRESAREVLLRFPGKVSEYRAGKVSLLGMFIGELMRSSDPKPNPKTAGRILAELLANPTT